MQKPKKLETFNKIKKKNDNDLKKFEIKLKKCEKLYKDWEKKSANFFLILNVNVYFRGIID